MRRALLAAVFIVGCAGKADPTGTPPAESPVADARAGQPNPPPDRTPAASVAAGTLWLEYGSNIAAADLKYTGRFVQIGADVHSVVRDGNGYALGCLVYADEDTTRPPGVLARFPAAGQGSLAALKPHQRVLLVGRCLGRVDSADARNGYVIILEDCRFDAPGKK